MNSENINSIQKKYKFFYRIISVMAVIYFSYLLYINLGTRLMHNYFLIQRVKIKGIENIPTDRLLTLSGLSYGDSLLTISKKTIKNNLEQHPRIKVNSITRIYPDTVRIVVKEISGNTAIISQNSPAHFMELDSTFSAETGHKILEAGDFLQHPDKIFIHSQELQSFISNNYFNNPDINSIMSTINSLPEAEKDILNIISDIYLQQDGEILIYTRHKPIPITVGVELTLEKLRKIRYALLYIEEKKYKIKKIDLRFDTAKFQKG